MIKPCRCPLCVARLFVARVFLQRELLRMLASPSTDLALALVECRRAGLRGDA